MKAAGSKILSDLKSDTILKRKPFLKIRSNHRRDRGPFIYRLWDSMVNGTAISDGKGWFKRLFAEGKKQKPRSQEKPDIQPKLATGTEGFTLIEVITTVLCVSILLAFIFSMQGCTYSEGERTGTIIKVSKKGFIFKTWEGELNVGAFGTGRKSSTIAYDGGVWAFSIGDEKIVSKVQDAVRKGELVTLKYNEVFPTGFPNSTTYFVTEVAEAQK